MESFDGIENIDRQIESTIASIQQKLNDVVDNNLDDPKSFVPVSMKLKSDIFALEKYQEFKSIPFWKAVFDRVNTNLEDVGISTMISATVVGVGTSQASGLDMQRGLVAGAAAGAIAAAVAYIGRCYEEYKQEDLIRDSYTKQAKRALDKSEEYDK